METKGGQHGYHHLVSDQSITFPVSTHGLSICLSDISYPFVCICTLENRNVLRVSKGRLVSDVSTKALYIIAYSYGKKYNNKCRNSQQHFFKESNNTIFFKLSYCYSDFRAKLKSCERPIPCSRLLLPNNRYRSSCV